MPSHDPKERASTRSGSVDGAPPSSNNQPPNPSVRNAKRTHSQSGTDAESFRKGVTIAGAAHAVASRAAASMASRGPTNLTAPIQDVQVQDQSEASGNVYNPFLAPQSSIHSCSTKRQRTTSGFVNRRSRYDRQARQAYDIPGVCKTSGRLRNDYNIGQIISMPFHNANLDPNLDPQHPCLANTPQGPVFSKRRMLVILWIHEEDMFCLPIYSFEGKGLRNKPPQLIAEYICLKDYSNNHHRPQGDYEAVEGYLRNGKLHEESVVHLAGGLRVSCRDNIFECGNMTKDGFDMLLYHWKNLTHYARQRDSW